jgi:hypothetical protein
MIDLLEASISARIDSYAARSLEDIPDVVRILDLFDLDLERVGIRALALERCQYEACSSTQ